MRPAIKHIILALTLICLTLSACGQPAAPVTAQPETGDDPAMLPTNTAVIAPSETPLPPTPDNMLAATPTIPAPLMTPGYAIDQADYIYYEQLLLVGGESNPPVEIDTSYGLSIVGTTCGTCDLGIVTVLKTSHTEKAVDIMTQVALYRFASMDLVQERILQEIAAALASGAVQEEVPQGVQLPADTYIFTDTFTSTVEQGGTGVILISFYKGFEIYLAQANPTDLTKEELVEFFCQLAEMQISKLAAAGY